MIDMDVCDELIETKKCFKFSYELLDSLNVAYNAPSSMVIFWNKYQLFLYENLNFEDATRIFTLDFFAHQIIISNNYLVCLDCSGNVHVTSLKFKSTQKRLKTNFQPREKNILALFQQDEYVISLKLESKTLCLCLNKIDGDFSNKSKIPVKYKDETWPLPTKQEKCMITTHKVSDNSENIRQLFNLTGNIPENSYIVILSLDKMDVFGCLFSPNVAHDEIRLIKLYSCPSEICNIQFIQLEELNIVIVLNSGSVLKLTLQKSSPPPTPVHLNTAVSKFVSLRDTLMYTDGASMWKTENMYSKINFRQFFMRHVKDFVMCGDHIICTTYTNLIYYVPDEDTCYLIPNSQLYCPAEKLLNNSEYVCQLLEDIEVNNELIEKLNEEGNYITALALSNRQDLMDGVLRNSIVVYEHYEDAVKENPDLKLTEDLKEYFKTESVYILITIKIIQMEHLVNQILAQLFQNSKIHVSLFSELKLLKTTSLNISESLSKISVLVPLDYKLMANTSIIKANIKIVTYIPGAFDLQELIWTTLYKKEFVLNSEHLIKSDLISNRTKSLKEPQETIEDSISKTASSLHGSLFKVTDVSNSTDYAKFSTYVKLPSNYADIFKNQELFNNLNTRRADYLSKQLASDEFLKSKSHLTFEIGIDKVDVEIITEGNPLLRVTSKNVSKAMSLRNFFADLLHGDLKSAGSEVQFTDYAFYTTVENLQKAIKDCSNPEALNSLAEQLQKTIAGALPI